MFIFSALYLESQIPPRQIPPSLQKRQAHFSAISHNHQMQNLRFGTQFGLQRVTHYHNHPWHGEKSDSDHIAIHRAPSYNQIIIRTFVSCYISVMTSTPFFLIVIVLDSLIFLLFTMILSDLSRYCVALHPQRCCRIAIFFASATCGNSLRLGLGVPQLPNSSSGYV